MEHAKLSASGSHTWLHCTAQPELTKDIPPKESGEGAKQGTACHALAEYLYSNEWEEVSEDKRSEKIRELAGEYMSDDLYNAAIEFNDICNTILEDIKAEQNNDNVIKVEEQKVDLSKWIPEGFGTTDTAIIGSNILHIIDLKYGKINVEAFENPQLLIYALGVANKYNFKGNIIRMTIFQPRVEDRIKEFEISRYKLYAWANCVLKPNAYKAFHGLGEKRMGKWCQFCPLNSKCSEGSINGLLGRCKK